LNEYRLKEAGQGSEGPSSARANNLLSRAPGKARNYPTGPGCVRLTRAVLRSSHWKSPWCGKDGS